MTREVENKSGRDGECNDFGDLLWSPVQPLQQQPNAYHLPTLEGVGETKKCHCSHAPRSEIVARRNIERELPPNRHDHHDREDHKQENAGGVPSVEIDTVESTPEEPRG